MQSHSELASWLLTRRADIDRELAARLGEALPRAAAPESEVLRRFRSFVLAALRRGRRAPPALDGLRADAARSAALLEAWTGAATDLAGPRADELRSQLGPLLRHFRTALSETLSARNASGPPRVGRRAVTAAIDRVADAFLAIDVDSGRIADTNPAAGSLLGVERNRLLTAEALAFVPPAARPLWTTHLDAMAEGGEPVRFRSQLVGVRGDLVEVEARMSRYATRERTLALVLARPV